VNRIEYDALEGCNFSTLKDLLRSPAHYQAALAAKGQETEEDRQRFIVGTCLHAMVLEGKPLLSMYAVKPEGMSFATKEGKLWREQQTLPTMGADTAAQVQAMVDAVNAHPLASAILKSCPSREHGLQADINGVLCKGLIDAIGKDASGNGIIVDLKSTRDARSREFRRKIEWEFHYDLQARLYQELALQCDHGECTPLWIVVETEAPHSVMVYQPGADLRASGERKLQEVLTKWKECTASGVWHGYQQTPTIEEI